MSVGELKVGLRERRRAETIAEIKEAALQQLAEAGPGGMSLRGVARTVGTTVQALYHYFDSRDALLDQLVTDGHNALADSIQHSADLSRGRPYGERLLATNLAYRDWAFANRSAFLLLYGTPVPGFEPSADGLSVEAAMRLAAPFREVVFDGWTADQLRAVPLLPGAEPIAEDLTDGFGLPPGALALFLELRARLHGLVMLELLGHLHPLQHQGRALLTSATDRIASELTALRNQ